MDLELTDWGEGCVKDVTSIANGYDWFLQQFTEFELKRNSDTHHCEMLLGSSKKITKISPIVKNYKLSDRVMIQYWDGSEWQYFPMMYQLKKIITDGKVCPLFGAYWDSPESWKVAELNEVTDSYFNANAKSEKLYWIKITLADLVDFGESLTIKSFKCCYTNVFLTKGRNLYLMENWNYVKHIYTFNNELNRNIKIDSIAFDKELKCAIVHLIEDNHYEYRKIGSYILDWSGKFKGFQPIYDDGYQTICLRDRPESMYRAGQEQTMVTTIDGAPHTVVFNNMGVLEETFLEALYPSGAFAGNISVGYNIPICKPQFVRKYSVRNKNWSYYNPGTPTDGWSPDDFLNNVWLVKSPAILTVATEIADSVFFSLTNNGLLMEELINGPFTKVKSGYYAAFEKAYQVWGLRYEYLITDEIYDLPLAPGVGEYYLLMETANPPLDTRYGQLAYWDGTVWSYSTPAYGTVVYIQDTGVYKWKDFDYWRDYSTELIWPGRVQSYNNTFGIGLEFTLGQESVKVPYFRAFNSRPERFLDNNVIQYYDDKMVTSLRHVQQHIDGSEVIGHPDSTYLSWLNSKATCAVEMKDASSVKDSEGPTDARRVIEMSSPAVAFGAYEFEEVISDGSLDKWTAGGCYPYGISYIATFKQMGKIRNWFRAFQLDDVKGYVDITDDLNYKDRDKIFTIDAGHPIYVCCENRFFAFMAKFAGAYSDLSFDLLNSLGAWSPVSLFSSWDNHNDEYPTDEWLRKTVGYTYLFDPTYERYWARQTFNGVGGYWMRLKGTMQLYWAVLSGCMVFDIFKWWEDYNLTSRFKPTGTYTEDDYRKFDSYVPISIEYDIVRKRIIGCFWDFKTDQYYPFIIPFKADRLRSKDDAQWSWEPKGIEILDSVDYQYYYRMRGIRRTSPINCKALLVDDRSESGTAIMANLKNFSSGDKLFNFELGIQAPGS